MTKEEAKVILKGFMENPLYSDIPKVCRAFDMAIKALDEDPKSIDYYDCSSAMLKLWMENIVTDSEYYRIIDKLNARHKEGKI